MIRNLESGHTRYPHAHSVRLLAWALGLDDAAGELLLAAAKAGPVTAPVMSLLAAAKAGPLTAPVMSLPPDAVSVLPPTGLVGRDGLLAAVTTTLASMPVLVTLSGLAGVGKTALAVAAAQLLHQRDGFEVWWISCRGAASPGTQSADLAEIALPNDVADRLGVRAVMLVFDAVEHRSDTADDIERLRAAHPTLRILATGLRPLHLASEHQWIVTPLELPADNAPTASLTDVPAVRMFVDRLRQRRPDYRLTDSDAPAVAALVRRLDGLPLALELAAGHGRVFTPADLLRRYGSNTLSLTGACSLRDVLNRSIELLDEKEKALLEDLAVFLRSWTIELAVATAREEHDVERVLDHLCEMGLVQPTVDASTMRFHMLDSVRQLLLEPMAARGALTPAQRRHSKAVLAAAQAWAAGLNGQLHLSCLKELDNASDDIMAALAVAGENDQQAALDAATELSRYWCARSRTSLGRSFIEGLLPGRAGTTSRPHAHLSLARLQIFESRHEEAERNLRRALELFDSIGDERSRVDTLLLLTRNLREQGRFTEGTQVSVTAFRLAAQVRDAWRTAAALNNMVFDDLRYGRFQAATRRLGRVRRAFEPMSRQRAIVTLNEADMLRLAGQDAEARDAYAESISMLKPFQEPALLAQAYCRLAMCEGVRGDRTAASTHLAAAESAANELDSDLVLPWLDLAAGTIAERRGDVPAAAQLFWRAASLFAARGRRRETVEAAIQLARVVPLAERPAVLSRAHRLCAEGQFALTEQEHQMIDSLEAGQA